MKRIEGKFNLYKQHLNALFDRNNFNHRHTKRSERFISFYLYWFEYECKFQYKCRHKYICIY